MVRTAYTVAFAPLVLAASALSDAAAGTLQGIAGGKCLDLPGDNAVNGAELWMWDCTGGTSQQWAFNGGELKYDGGVVWIYCVDLPGNDQSNGQGLWLWECGGTPQQQWGYDSEAQTVYLASSAGADASKCLGGGVDNGDQVWLWDCLPDEDSQKWLIDGSVPPSPGPAPAPSPSPETGVSQVCVQNRGAFAMSFDVKDTSTDTWAGKSETYGNPQSKCVDLSGIAGVQDGDYLEVHSQAVAGKENVAGELVQYGAGGGTATYACGGSTLSIDCQLKGQAAASARAIAV